MTDGQIPLIDVAPEHSSEIVECAKKYKAAQSKRVEYLNEEKAQKERLLSLIDDENLERLEDGRIRFTVDGYTITVTPRDELVQVKEADE